MDPLVPSITAIPAQYRGPSSSSEYNTVQRSAYNDVLNAFAALQAQNAQTQLANEVLTNQLAQALQTLSALNTQLQGLQGSYNSLLTLGSSSASALGTASLSSSLYAANVSYGGFPGYYPATAPLPTAQRATYAPQYGQILPNIATAPLSKAYVIDLLSQQVIYPANVASAAQAVITPTLAPFTVEENDLGLAVDGLQSTFWRRNLYFPATSYVSEVQTTVTLSMPEQFINNLTCNYVTIHPYPEFGVDIASVVLHGTPGSADIQLLPVDTSGQPIPISKAGKTRLIFPDTDVISIDITLRCATPNYVMRPGLQCFTLGASVLDFGSIGFTQGSSRVLIPFTLSNNFFQYVSNVTPAVNGVLYNLYYADPSGNIIPFNLGDSLPGFVQTVYVEAVLTPAQGLVPVLTSLALQFMPVYTQS